MAEKQVSLDGRRYALDDTFFVIATQNPVESHGTYPLPEAQMDRFGLQFSLGYVSPQEEVDMLSQQSTSHPLAQIRTCAGQAEVIEMRNTIKTTTVSEELKRYIVDIVSATRQTAGVKVGASFRASLTLLQTAQALALFDGEAFVSPEHVQELAVAVLAHRLSLNPQSRFSGRDGATVVQEILQTVPVPV